LSLESRARLNPCVLIYTEKCVSGAVPDAKRLAIYLGAFIGPLSGNAVLALVPTLKGEFNATAPDVLVSISFFMIPFAFFTLFSGTISDVYDRKKTVAAGFTIYAVGSLLCSASVDLNMFLLSRTVQGLGYGFVNPVLVAILGDIVPFKDRGKAMGYLGAATTTGIALGPFVAGFIAIINWRFMFIVVATLVLLVGLFFSLAFKGTTFERGGGGFTSVLGSLGRTARQRSVALLSLAGFLTFMCYVATLSFISDTLSLDPLSLSESDIGIVMATTGVAGIVAAPMGGKMVDRLGRYTTATIGFVIIILAFSLLTFSSTVGHHTGSLAVLGVGTAITWSALLTLTVEVLPEQRGTTSSLFNGARFFGYALAPMIFAPVYTSLGIHSIYYASIALATGAMLVTLLIRLNHREPRFTESQ